MLSTVAGYFESNETATFTFATAITAFGIDIDTFAPLSGDYLAATTNLGNGRSVILTRSQATASSSRVYATTVVHQRDDFRSARSQR